jgi:hypothetical protein
MSGLDMLGCMVTRLVRWPRNAILSVDRPISEGSKPGCLSVTLRIREFSFDEIVSD